MTMLVIVSCYADLTVFLCCCYNNKEDKKLYSFFRKYLLSNTNIFKFK